MGYLYPDFMTPIHKCTDSKQLVEALENTSYHFIKDANLDANNNNEALETDDKIDDVLKQEMSRRFSMAFENGFHFGVFYAYFHLKLLEISNICWFADLISLNMPKNQPGWNKYYVPFKYHINANGGYE